MKNWMVSKKLDDLSEKIGNPPRDGVARLDFDCFSEPEKALFRSIWELQQEHGERLSVEVLEANKDLIFKANETIFKYVMNDLRFTLLCFFGDPESEINKWYFNLHFYNFITDLRECLERVQKWPEKEVTWFRNFLEGDGMKDKVFRFPRGSTDLKTDIKREKKKQ